MKSEGKLFENSERIRKKVEEVQKRDATKFNVGEIKKIELEEITKDMYESKLIGKGAIKL